MIVNGYGEHALGARLTNHIFVQHSVNVSWRRHTIMALGQSGFMLFTDNVHTQFDTFIADEHGRTGNQLADLMLAFPTE